MYVRHIYRNHWCRELHTVLDMTPVGPLDECRDAWPRAPEMFSQGFENLAILHAYSNIVLTIAWAVRDEIEEP